MRECMVALLANVEPTFSKDRQFDRPPRLAWFDRRVGPEGLVATRKFITLGDGPAVETKPLSRAQSCNAWFALRAWSWYFIVA
jgi:hypothetical protein